MSKLYEDDICERQFHIYYNPSKQAAEREQLEQNLDRMKMYLDKHIGEVLTIPKSYKKYFNVHINKKVNLLLMMKIQHTSNQSWKHVVTSALSHPKRCLRRKL